MYVIRFSSMLFEWMKLTAKLRRNGGDWAVGLSIMALVVDILNLENL